MRLFHSLILTALLASAVNAQDLAQTTDRKDEVEQLFHTGEKAYNSGAYTKASELFSAVLERDPEHINAYLQRGFCHSLQREYDLAVVDFSSVIERKSDHAWAYISRGSAYNSLGKPELAMHDFDAVLGLDPKDEEAYNNRGWAKKALGDAPGACQDWKTSKKLGNGEAKIILANNRCK